MKVFAHNSVNFGDYLAQWIPQQLGHEVELVESDCNEDHIAITGSILNHTNEHCTVWGAGIARESDSIGNPKQILATRGHLSRAKAEAQGYTVQAVGDPCLLLPDFYIPIGKKECKLAIIPHFADYYDAMQKYRDVFDKDGPVCNIVNLLQFPYKVIHDVITCEYAISSSLHGLILAHAYGIPCRWVEFGDKVLGDGFKFRDYFSSVGISQEPLDLREPMPVSEIISHIPPDTGTFDRKQLWDCCPFKH